MNQPFRMKRQRQAFNARQVIRDWALVASLCLLVALVVIGVRQLSWHNAVPAADLKPEVPVMFQLGRERMYLVKVGGRVFAIPEWTEYGNCPHWCQITWNAEEHKFMHQPSETRFDLQGRHLGGRLPVHLDRFATRIIWGWVQVNPSQRKRGGCISKYACG